MSMRLSVSIDSGSRAHQRLGAQRPALHAGQSSCVGSTTCPEKRTAPFTSRMKKRKGRSMLSETMSAGAALPAEMVTAVAAAASVPFSSTLMNAFWMTWLIQSGSAPLSRSTRPLWKPGTSEAPRETGSSSARGALQPPEPGSHRRGGAMCATSAAVVTAFTAARGCGSEARSRAVTTRHWLVVSARARVRATGRMKLYALGVPTLGRSVGPNLR